MRWIAMVVATMGCVTSTAVTCPDGTTTCPEDTVCIALAETMLQRCVEPAAVTACDGLDEGADCAFGVTEGVCYSGACIESVCGDGFQDASEACDDGNNDIGDGCAPDCKSAEVCRNGVIDPVVIGVGGIAEANETCDDGDTLGHDGCSNVCQLEAPRWELITTSGPPARAMTAATYDSARARVVMFGGNLLIDNSSPASFVYNDTWSWNGRSWRRLATVLAPTQRYGHALAYDPRSEQIVLFGGTENGPLADTWVLEGDAWRQLAPMTSPPGRSGHMMAYLPGLGVVLFGGQGLTGLLDDTWVWDGTTWRELEVTTRPEARAWAGLALDPRRGVLVLAGGQGGPHRTWELSGTTWVETTPAEFEVSPGVMARIPGHVALGYDPTSDAMIAFGGQSEVPAALGTIYRLDGSTWTRLTAQVALPTARSSAVFFPDPLTGHLQLFGGYLLAASNCLSCLHTTFASQFEWTRQSDGTYVWADRSQATPPRRSRAAFALDTRRAELVLYGGWGQNSRLADLWRFDGYAWRLLKSNDPGERAGAAMAYDAARDEIVLFGGEQLQFSETWVLAGDDTWTQMTPATSPTARYDHAMAADPTRQRIVMFGGYNDFGLATNDTWEWDGVQWHDVTPASSAPGPSPRANHVLAYDPIRQRIVLFGGDRGGLLLNDMWEWDGMVWSERTPTTQIAARTQPGLAWNPNRQRLVVFGGQSVAPLNDTHELAPTGWVPVPSVLSPDARAGSLLAPAPDGSGVIAFGGIQSTGPSQQQVLKVFDDTWRLSWTSDATYETCQGSRDDDRDGTSACGDDDCWYVCTPGCPPGAPCDTTMPRCGDGTCNAALENCRNCPGDCPCEARCGDLYCDAPETAQTCPGDCQ